VTTATFRAAESAAKVNLGHRLRLSSKSIQKIFLAEIKESEWANRGIQSIWMSKVLE
jgi:hypothetical protein